MITAVTTVLGVLLILNLVGMYYLWLKLNAMSVRTSYIVEHIAGVKRDTETLGKVLKVYEDETKILQKKAAEVELKKRFQRQPR